VKEQLKHIASLSSSSSYPLISRSICVIFEFKRSHPISYSSPMTTYLLPHPSSSMMESPSSSSSFMEEVWENPLIFTQKRPSESSFSPFSSSSSSFLSSYSTPSLPLLPPHLNTSSPIIRITGEELHSLMLEGRRGEDGDEDGDGEVKRRDMLLLITAPFCGHCIAFQPVFNEVFSPSNQFYFISFFS